MIHVCICIVGIPLLLSLFHTTGHIVHHPSLMQSFCKDWHDLYFDTAAEVDGEFVLAVGAFSNWVNCLVHFCLVLLEVTPGVSSAEMQLSKYLYITVSFQAFEIRYPPICTVFPASKAKMLHNLLSRRDWHTFQGLLKYSIKTANNQHMHRHLENDEKHWSKLI